MKGYIILDIVFGLNGNVKMIKVTYLVINAHLSFNIIIGRYAFNLVGDTLYLCMKYSLLDKRIRGDPRRPGDCPKMLS